MLNGDDRDRTGNLLVAKQALSQLSYEPLERSAGDDPTLYYKINRLGGLRAVGSSSIAGCTVTIMAFWSTARCPSSTKRSWWPCFEVALARFRR
jgi:hypothetical protein